MKITEIEVSMGLTANLGDFNNCRPEVRLRAELEDGDDLDASYAVLMDEARQKVHDEVDTALMRLGQSPRYYTGPLYSVMAIGEFKAVVVYSTDSILSPLQFSRGRRLLNEFPLGQCVERAHLYGGKHAHEVFVVENQTQLDDLIASLKEAQSTKEPSPLDNF